jgi:hypothetical protein
VARSGNGDNSNDFTVRRLTNFEPIIKFKTAQTFDLTVPFLLLSRYSARMRGGGRSHPRTCLHSQIPCQQGKIQGIFQFRACFLAAKAY